MVVPMRLNAELTTKPEADMTRLDQIDSERVEDAEKTRRLGKGREGKGTRREREGRPGGYLSSLRFHSNRIPNPQHRSQP